MKKSIATVDVFEDENGFICARMTDDAGMDIEGYDDDAVGALNDLAFNLELFIGGAYDAMESALNQEPNGEE